MSKKSRQTSNRVKEMQAEARRKEQRRRSLIVGGIVAVLIVAVVAVAVVVQQSRDDTGTGANAPAGATDDFGVVRGDASAPVKVVVYEDFQCPICKEIEGLVGETLTKNVDDKTVSVEYRPVAFLDRASSTDYSSRALATAACTLDQSGTDAYLALHDLLFANQPPEQSAGLDDAKLAELAGQAGADPSSIETCQSDGTFDDWVKAATDAASKAKVTGTPTFLVDGEQVTFTNDTPPAQTLQDAIDAAAGS